MGNRDSLVGVAKGYGMDGQVRFPARETDFCVLRSVQTGSGTHLTSYPMGTKGFSPGGKVAGVWIWPLTPI
jgi:hypothetical protein